MSGFIYFIVHIKDPKDTYYNIGSTKRPVEKRLKEKPRGSKKHLCFKVDDYKTMERTIHKALDAYRVYRYFTENEEFITVWKHNKKPVTEADEVLAAKHRLQGIHKYVEWFRLSWKEIEAVVIPLIRNELPKQCDSDEDDTASADGEPHGNPGKQGGAKQFHGDGVSNGHKAASQKPA